MAVKRQANSAEAWGLMAQVQPGPFLSRMHKIEPWQSMKYVPSAYKVHEVRTL